MGSVSHGRRVVLKAALGLGLCFSFMDGVSARADDPRVARPQEGDRFVFPFGDREGQLITVEDLTLGGPQQLAYPMDPHTKVVRNGSTLNLALLVRFDSAQLTEETRALAADGVVAYSAVCTHQGCPVSMWQAQAKTLFCACHASQFDPLDRARVVDGPAPRRLPMLPIKMVDGALTVAGGFTGRVGGERPS
ncbi:MAG: 2Fe-2S ferredoxin [Candidatus Rokuibacteriota bacterium]|nr:MAG: 2Fe-2S ferredoxin [Candidatus Rokubacteria bacterium]